MSGEDASARSHLAVLRREAELPAGDDDEWRAALGRLASPGGGYQGWSIRRTSLVAVAASALPWSFVAYRTFGEQFGPGSALMTLFPLATILAIELWLRDVHLARASLEQDPFVLRDAIRATLDAMPGAPDRERWESLLHRVATASASAPSAEARPPFDELLVALKMGAWDQRLVAAHALAAVGPRAGPALLALALDVHDGPSQRRVSDVLARIVRDAPHADRPPSTLACPDCYLRCIPHRFPRPGRGSGEFVGCPRCKRGDGLLPCRDGMVAVLDRDLEEPHRVVDERVEVHWLRFRKPFDLTAVRVVRAEDRDVEELAICFGNDTEPGRRAVTEMAEVELAPGSSISRNARKVMERTFGRVRGASRPPGATDPRVDDVSPN